MKTLTAATLAEMGLTVTRPGYLVQMGFSVTLYLSTMGDISWDGYAWSAADVRVQGIKLDGSSASAAAVQLGNSDGAYGALVLAEGARNKAVKIWACYAGATASGDPSLVFEGVADTAGFDADGGAVTISLVDQSSSTLESPRVVIGPSSGFNFLQPAGKTITFNGETFVLER